MLTSASPGRAAAMVPAPVERSQLRGHRNRSENLQHLQCGRSPSLAQRCGGCGTERSAEFGRFNHTLCPHARARGGADSRRALRQTDLHRPAGRRCGCWPTSPLLFSGICCSQIRGRTMELGIGANADVGFAWSGGGDGAGAGRAQPATGSSQQIGKSAALTVRALSLARAALRRLRH